MLHLRGGGDGDIITFINFYEGGLLSETCEYMKSGNKSDDDSTMPPLIIGE